MLYLSSSAETMAHFQLPRWPTNCAMHLSTPNDDFDDSGSENYPLPPHLTQSSKKRCSSGGRREGARKLQIVMDIQAQSSSQSRVRIPHN